ncbi:uroporphyrinogen-III C-methyltransferase [Gallibacterium genomosp. 1]|uniref:HemX protein n=1 Tax=Gallibacterium genomosp. 1 TaxID=155515 RepID=A0A0A2Y8F9_9PAST|nr:uroporphyrinogen-III C-methyltransferase [Gallibacterium genomosp. 1]KGQ38890.1 HemX protein [Gallibacterium genomosp. 1]
MKKQHNETDIQTSAEINEGASLTTDENSSKDPDKREQVDSQAVEAENTAEKIVVTDEKKASANKKEDKLDKRVEVDTTVEEDKTSVNSTSTQAEKAMKTTENKQKSSGGKGLALLALLVALGVGAAGYYLGQQQLSNLQQQVSALESSQQVVIKAASSNSVDMTEVNSLKEALTKTEQELNATKSTLDVLQQNKGITEQQIIALQTQLNKTMAERSQTQPNEWLMSEADFLLSNAQRKLIIDNDLGTAISLLKEADLVLNDVTDPRAITVRTAIAQDLKRLANVNDVDQNAIMQKLSQLANSIDDLELLDLSASNSDSGNSDEPSNSISDWKSNIEKSANSFLNHFIRIQPRDPVEKALLAPNQDIYLRENIRLRLQIAILAVPRQQNELYKSSLEAVTSWVRSYFNVDSALTQKFLQQLDELSEQSIYVDAPNTFESLTILDEILHKQSHQIEKVDLKANSQILEENKEEEKVTTEVGSESVVDDKVPEAQQPVSENPNTEQIPEKTE